MRHSGPGYPGAVVSDLFSSSRPQGDGSDPGVLPPLAVRMRPRTVEEVRGQQEALRPGSPLRRLIEGSAGAAGPLSAILWGPPGTGKTTLAHLVATAGDRDFVELSAVTAGVKDVRAVMDQALRTLDLYGRNTVLFLDEIHRFTKAQQDALLPGVENRHVILVAATTENPSFSIIAPAALTVGARHPDLTRRRGCRGPAGLGGEGRAGARRRILPRRRRARPPRPGQRGRRPAGPHQRSRRPPGWLRTTSPPVRSRRCR
jgi:hypothetical protein